MIEESIESLIKKFNIIKNMGYVKGTKQGNVGNSGLTFENLIGKQNDTFQFADYEGIEIKVRSIFSNRDITLFNLVPSNNFGIGLKNLREKYGVADKDFPDKNKLNFLAISNKKIKINGDYYSELKVDYSNKKIWLNIYDKNKLDNNDLYWDFDEIETITKNKLSYLCLIKYYKKIINKDRYFKFKDINIYKFIGFDNFIDMIDKGYITLYINMGIYKSGYRIGKYHDYGVRFDVSEFFLSKIYNKLAC